MALTKEYVLEHGYWEPDPDHFTGPYNIEAIGVYDTSPSLLAQSERVRFQRQFIMPDKRIVTCDVRGDLEGMPFFYMTGMPGCAEGLMFSDEHLRSVGCCMVAMTRQGYDGSDRLEGRTIASSVDDVIEIANQLRFGRFGLIGRSAGVPYTLALGAKYPERVMVIAGFGGVAPNFAQSSDLLAGMAEGNTRDFTKVDLESTRKLARAVIYGADMLPRYEEMSESDRIFARQFPHYVDAIQWGTTRALMREGYLGHYDDKKAHTSYWGFELLDIDPSIPIYLWNGEDDAFTTMANALRLKELLPQAHLAIAGLAGHLEAVREVQMYLPILLSYNRGEYPASALAA